MSRQSVSFNLAKIERPLDALLNASEVAKIIGKRSASDVLKIPYEDMPYILYKAFNYGKGVGYLHARAYPLMSVIARQNSYYYADEFEEIETFFRERTMLTDELIEYLKSIGKLTDLQQARSRISEHLGLYSKKLKPIENKGKPEISLHDRFFALEWANEYGDRPRDANKVKTGVAAQAAAEQDIKELTNWIFSLK